MIKKVRQIVRTSKDYDFLKENDKLGEHIELLVVGGSYAYGTNTAGSDIDLRGFALNTKREILTNKDFGHVKDNQTDTIIYSFNKFITMLTKCNINCIELLGCKKENYLHIGVIGRLLLDNADIFLSQKITYIIEGYVKNELKKVREYKKIQSTNQEKLCKSMMHIIRLYAMGYNILRDGKITTFRKNDHDLLMDLRNGVYINYKGEILPEFYDVLSIYKKKFNYVKNNTVLPLHEDVERIEYLTMCVNEKIVLGRL
ncbi:MAG: DNA polymerase beta superfamily protein [Anaerostipes sp.]|uniref:DNA polymerase beta superfamily protein n=1 Tax=Anaerostipes sp. TaxID=1872530 RepID=UPI0039955167